MKSLARLRAARSIDVPSALVAFILTAAAFAAVFVVSARTLLFRSETPRARLAIPHETLVYLDRTADMQQPVERLPREPTRTSSTPRVPPTQRSSTNSADVFTPTTKSEAGVGPSPIFLPPYRPQPRFTPSPFDAPKPRNPFLSEEPRTRAEMDSILAVMSQGIPLFAKTRTPTAAERDELMRAQSSGQSVTVPGRQPQVIIAQGSIGLPLFASGPSSAERKRDSAANAEYVARLRRLQARVSASRESLRVADSMSRARMP